MSYWFKQYLTPAHFDNETVQIIMDEALKYEGFPYVFGGSSPSTSFDCSGLVQWCYAKASIQLPRTAQAQYDATTHILLSSKRKLETWSFSIRLIMLESMSPM